MDPRRLLTFRAVAHARSFSRAAEGLSLTQPSVSHQIALLETEIGVRLLERGRGGLRLTHAGAVLLEHADHVAGRLELADAQLASLAGEYREHVRLGAFPTALAGFVPAAVARLRLTRHDLRLRLGEVTPITLTELADDDWIVASTEGFLVQACRDVGFEPRIVATTSEPLATRGMVLRGIGVGWVPSLLAGDYTGVAVRPVREAIRRRDVYALLPPGERRRPLDSRPATGPADARPAASGSRQARPLVHDPLVVAARRAAEARA